MSPVPDDPITSLAEMAVQVHELYEAYFLYEAYVAAGFTEQQALYLVGRVVTPQAGLD